VRGSEFLELGKGNGRENECGEKNDDGKDTHGAQYGAEPRDRQGARGGMGRSLPMIVKSVGVSTASVEC
jgi:hypothetical protein